MKVYENVLEKRMRDMVAIGNCHFEFCQGRSTAGALFFENVTRVKRIRNYNQRNKKLYLIFVDLEKAFDRVPRKVIEWALRRKGILKRMVEAVVVLDVNSRTKV